MKRQETISYRPSHYLDWANVTQHDRKEMCQWGFNIVDACGVERSLAVVAITYFDRFLSCRGVRVVEVCLASQREFQLAFITCLVISLKGREGMKISPDFVAETLCEQMYHPEEVIEMEVEVLRTLQWKLNGPIPQDFIQCFMELLPSSNDETAHKFFLAAVKRSEIAMLDYVLALEPPSNIALASVTSLISNLDTKTQYQLNVTAWMRCIGFVTGASSTDLDQETTCKSIQMIDVIESDSNQENVNSLFSMGCALSL
ncbi:hypothetical protein ACHAW6_002075 [Cyclotella cf. meneghiniana]